MSDDGTDEREVVSEYGRVLPDGGENESESESQGNDEDEENEENSDGENEGSEENEENGNGENGNGENEGSESKGTDVLALDLEGLYVNLLGVEIDLNEVVLDVTATPGSGNLLGNLLAPILGLLDDGVASSLLDKLPGGGLPSVSSLAPEGGFPSPIEWLRGTASRLWGVLTAPSKWTKGKLESDEEDDETGLVDDLQPEGGLPSRPSRPSLPSLPPVSGLFYRLLNAILDGVLAVLAAGEGEKKGGTESEDESEAESERSDGENGSDEQ